MPGDPVTASRNRDPRYFTRRALLIERGQWRPFTDAAPARAHVRALMAAGVSRAQIARRAAVSESSLCHLLYGGQQKIRPAAAGRILRITADTGRPAGPCLVNTAGTSRRLQALTVLGWSPRLLAGRLGMDLGAVRRMRDGGRGRVHSGTSEAVSNLYKALWNTAPPAATTPERIAATKARAHATRRGWVPPMAWDDDQLDRPDGRPASGWQRTRQTHRAADLAEDAAELFAQGYDREHAAQRLCVTLSGLEKALGRAGQAAEREHETQRARFAAASAQAANEYQAEAG